jgi:tetratricopeptide (TPR) repeat protein
VIFFLAMIACPGVWLAGETMRVAIAELLGRTDRMEQVQQALRLDSGNPELRRRLGLLYEWDLEQTDFRKAVVQMRQATSLQPNRADYWSELGEVCFVSQDNGCAEQAYARAVELAPHLPRYSWSIANYYLLTGRQSDALAYFRQYFERTDGDPSAAFSILLRAIGDPQMIRQALPDSRNDVTLAYIYFLSVNGYPEAAYKLWSSLVSAGLHAPFSEVRPFLERLIASGSFDQAMEVWRYLEQIGSIQIEEPRDSLVYNGEFEHDPLGAGFDWRDRQEGLFTVDFADQNTYRGHRCLRVDFDVPENADCEPVYQIVPVLPNQQYLLTAQVRSVDITSDSGPRLRVVDSQCPKCLWVGSDGVTGSTPWHLITLAFSTSSHTHAIRLSVWRPRTRTFPMEIQGHFWLDSVTLHSVPISHN